VNATLRVERTDSEELLRKKGLKRADLVYILDGEEDLGRRVERLRAIYNQWELTIARMNNESRMIVECQYQLASLVSPPRQPAAVASRPVVEAPQQAATQAELTNYLEALEKHAKLSETQKVGAAVGKAENPHETTKHNSHKNEDLSLFVQGQDTSQEVYYPNQQYVMPAQGTNLPGMPYQGLDRRGGPNSTPIPSAAHRQAAGPGAQTGQPPVVNPVPFGGPSGFTRGGQMPGQQYRTGGEGQIPGGLPFVMPNTSSGHGSSQSVPETHQKPETHTETHHPEPKHLKVVLPPMFQLRIAPNPIVKLEEAILKLMNEYFADELQARECVRDFQWQRKDVQVRAIDLRQQYERLAKDDEVLAALNELNKDATPESRVALGPREKYHENLAKMTDRLLQNEGVLKDPGGNYRFAMIGAVANNALKAESELKEALKHQKELQSDVDSRRRQLAVAVREKKYAKITALEKDTSRAEDALKAMGPDVAVKRDVYVQRVAALRKAVDEAGRKAADLQKQHQVSIGGINRGILQYLGRAETSIASRDFVLEPDKTIFWIKAVVNGRKEPTRMVFDPDVELIRMSAESAATLGIKTEGVGTLEDVTLDNGRKVAARRVHIKLVKVGHCIAENVECLVIPEGFDSAPILGASFLNRFSYRFDPDAEKLTLTRVDVKLAANH
jgi:clan AA aspartic protease (TIGR02281 family)